MARRERIQHRPAARCLTLGSIPGMDERASAEERLAALHAALLTFYDEHTSAFARQRPELSRRERLMSQGLQRLHLQWLPVLVALVVGAVRSMLRGGEVSGQLWPVVRAYGELAGKDRHVAQAEVLRMTAQLRPLDSRLPMSGELPRSISRAELEVAADALLRFYDMWLAVTPTIRCWRRPRPPMGRSRRSQRRCWIECTASIAQPRRSGGRTGSGRLRRTVVMSRRGSAGLITRPLRPSDRWRLSRSTSSSCSPKVRAACRKAFAYRGLPAPTQQQFGSEAIAIMRVADGKVAEIRGTTDRLGMLTQLGILPDIG
jgi:hypothetical protein